MRDRESPAFVTIQNPLPRLPSGTFHTLPSTSSPSHPLEGLPSYSSLVQNPKVRNQSQSEQNVEVFATTNRVIGNKTEFAGISVNLMAAAGQE